MDEQISNSNMIRSKLIDPILHGFFWRNRQHGKSESPSDSSAQF